MIRADERTGPRLTSGRGTRVATRLGAACLAAAALLTTGCASGDRVADRQYGQQFVCHDGEETLAVSTADMFVHQQHGDSLGPCPHDG